MNFITRKTTEGLSHLGWTVFWHIVGVDVVVTTISDGVIAKFHSTLGIPTLPTQFYVIFWILVFCAVLLCFVLSFVIDVAFKSTSNPTKEIPKTSNGPKSRLKIISAFYELDADHSEDVTDRMNQLPREGLVITVDNNTMGCDPAPNVPPGKYLRVRYTYGNDVIREIRLPENSRMVIPEQIEWGKPPVKYTKEQIDRMTVKETDQFLRSGDKDYAESANYWYQQKGNEWRVRGENEKS